MLLPPTISQQAFRSTQWAVGVQDLPAPPGSCCDSAAPSTHTTQAMERLQATKTFLSGEVDVNSLLSKK